MSCVYNLQVQYNEMLTHGAFLLNKEVKQAIRLELQTLLATSGSAVAGLAKQLSTLVHPTAAAAALPTRASTVVRQALRKVQSLHPGIGRANSSSVGEGEAKAEEGKAAGGAEGAAAEQAAKPVRQVPRSYSEGHGAGVLGLEEQLSKEAAAGKRSEGLQTAEKQQQGKEAVVAADGGRGGKLVSQLESAGDAECDVAAAVPDQQQ